MVEEWIRYYGRLLSINEERISIEYILFLNKNSNMKVYFNVEDLNDLIKLMKPQEWMVWL